MLRGPEAASREAGGAEDGAAVVDFTLVMLILIPLFLGIMQVGVYLYARNTMVACASEGARFGANYNRSPADGAARAADCIANALAPRFAGNVSSSLTSAGGQPMVVVSAHAQMPALGAWGPGVLGFSIEGHAVKEPTP